MRFVHGSLLALAAAAGCTGIAAGQCPPSDHDCFTTGGPGCTDVDCCNLVCASDPFCCNVAWDSICVSGALNLCGAPSCPFTCPGSATIEPEPCGADTNGGCNMAIPAFGSISCGETICGTAWAFGGTRDTDWYEITLTDEPGTLVTFSIVTTLPMVIGIVDTNGIPDCSLASFLNPFAVAEFCGSASVSACLPPGTYWFFAAPNGFDGFPCGSGANDYYVTLECLGVCEPPACGNSDHSCFVTGGPYCDDEKCCLIVCAIDPFCCDVAWDSICVAEANQFCEGGGGGPCETATHDCFTTGGPGCTDIACCNTVCAIDPFCCNTAWDAICVAEAEKLCVGGCPGDPDLNGDGCVDGADLGILLGLWGVGGGLGPADLNCDEIVDGADLGILLGAWTGPGC